MGQKVNPISFRLGINRSWNSVWHSTSNYADLLHEDLGINKYLQSVYERAGFLVGDCVIKRNSQKVSIILTISEAIKKRSRNIDTVQIQHNLERLTKGSVSLLVNEVATTSNAILLAKDIARKLEERNPFGIVLKKAMQTAMQSTSAQSIRSSKDERKILGIKIQCSGRLNGEDIARTEWVKEGQVPLHTLDASIDYASARAYTIYGVCGIKVWICFDSSKK